MLQVKGKTDLAVQAMHELGNVLFHSGNSKLVFNLCTTLLVWATGPGSDHRYVVRFSCNVLVTTASQNHTDKD